VLIIIATRTTITGMFMLLAPALSDASSSILDVSEGQLYEYSKTQHFMFARYSIAGIFKCDEPTISRNKQTADA
jgi:hypothetical protein